MKKIIIALAVSAFLLAASSHADPFNGLDRLTLELEDMPLASALSMIASQNNLNFVLPGDVAGTVSLRLIDVEVETALKAILAGHGYSYILRENIIVIKAIKSFDASELESRPITLKYLNPITAQKALLGRLSEKGKVVILDSKVDASSGQSEEYSPNRILITDYSQNINALVDLVSSIDVPERNILIEAKIIEITVDTKSELGLLWPSSFSSILDDAGGASSTNNTGNGSDSKSDAAVFDPNTGNFTWGKMSIQQLNLVLDLLEQEGNSRLVSNPRVTTIENHRAVMKIETIIPIQTINRFTEGAATSDIVSFEDEEVGLSLSVTPRINGEGTITLDIFPVIEDIIGFNGPTDNQKPITSSRSIKTRVTVGSGETVALGGLLKENEFETVQRVPLLGHIPILGKLLFTNTSKETNTTDLIIFITPTILP